MEFTERDNPLFFLFPFHAHQIGGVISNNSTMNYQLDNSLPAQYDLPSDFKSS